jgi:hypothetical protein
MVMQSVLPMARRWAMKTAPQMVSRLATPWATKLATRLALLWATRKGSLWVPLLATKTVMPSGSQTAQRSARQTVQTWEPKRELG